MEKIYVFDDGSLESKVMQYELKNTYDMTVIKAQPDKKLSEWLKQIDDQFNKIIKIFLHFPFEFYITKDIRTEILEAEHKNPKIRIIGWYEQASRDSIKHRAINYGIMDLGVKSKQEVEEIKKSFEPDKTIIVDPDTEMKDITPEPEKKKYTAPYKKRYRVA